MKKTLYAGLSLVFCSSSAMAELTLSGFVDMSAESITYQGKSARRLQSGNLNTSRIVFRDVEKLDNNMEAQFVYEWRFDRLCSRLRYRPLASPLAPPASLRLT